MSWSRCERFCACDERILYRRPLDVADRGGLRSDVDSLMSYRGTSFATFEEALGSTSRCSVGWACHAALTRLVRQQLTLVTHVGDTTCRPVSRDPAIAREPSAFRIA